MFSAPSSILFCAVSVSIIAFFDTYIWLVQAEFEALKEELASTRSAHASAAGAPGAHAAASASKKVVKKRPGGSLLNPFDKRVVPKGAKMSVTDAGAAE